jgi:hypothetical protein
LHIVDGRMDETRAAPKALLENRRFVLFAVALTGCSFGFTSSPRTAPCTTSRAPAIIDTVIASMASVALVVGIQSAVKGCRNDSEGVCGATTGGLIASGALLSAVFWPSAWLGYSRASQCEELMKRQ